MHKNKAKEDKKNKEPKLSDTPLNVWIKNLDRIKKSEFHKNVVKSELLWSQDKHSDIRRITFNNYRKKELNSAPYTSKIPIYIAALSVDPSLKIWDLFPDITPEYMGKFMPIIQDFAEKFNQSKNAEN